MNKSLEEGQVLTSEITEILKSEATGQAEVILNPPFIHLSVVKNMLQSHPVIKLGAQNCHQEVSGAFTGEVSAAMLKSIPVSHVILGHSERREYFHESDELLARKLDAVLEQELIPIFCCGEPLEIREKDEHIAYVTNQLTNSLFHLSHDQFSKIVIAYEPIWAIGTGKTASAQQAQDMHQAIREHLASKFGDLANQTSILYGGSVKPSNASEIFAMEDVDGGLIGGASLNARDFVDIVKAAG